MDITEFMTTRSPSERTQSPLWQYKDDILLLQKNKYSSARIAEWLALKNVVISESRIRAFLGHLKKQAKEEGRDHDQEPRNSEVSVPHAERQRGSELTAVGGSVGVPHAERSDAKERAGEVVNKGVPHAEHLVTTPSFIRDRSALSGEHTSEQTKEFLSYATLGKGNQS